MLTKKQAERIKKLATEIIATLPKAHYLKSSTIDLSLSDTAPTSFFDPKNWRIVISMTNIAEAVDGHKAEEWEDLEPTIRALTYHEISHALLTPKTLFRDAECHGISKEMANIIEDERIETILAHYYKGVDFKANAKAILKYNAPRCFEEWVFYGLRVRKAPFGLAEMISEFDKFVQKTKKIYGACGSFGLAIAMRDLLNVLQAIFDKYVEATKPEETSKGKETEEGEDGDKPEDSEETAEGKGHGEPKTKDGESDGEDGEKAESDGDNPEESANGEETEEAETDETETEEPETEDGEHDSGLTAEEIGGIVDDLLKSYKSTGKMFGKLVEAIGDVKPDMEAKTGMLKAIIRNKGVGVAQAPVIGGYNGKFSAKRYIKDQHLTMKWFDKSLDGGESEKRKGEKKILNIWLDQSGSFVSHDKSINRILSALNQIEKSRNDFEFRLIKLTGTATLVKDKEARYSCSFTGNALPVGKIARVYRETNNTQKELNIVLFDGPAMSMDIGSEDPIALSEYKSGKEVYGFEALKPFDNKRTIFITERSNTKAIGDVCPHCREIIEENDDYEGKLKANIIRAFDLLF